MDAFVCFKCHVGAVSYKIVYSKINNVQEYFKCTECRLWEKLACVNEN